MVKVSAVINLEHPALIAESVFPVILLQMGFASVDGEVDALSLLRSAIVVVKRSGQYRDESIIAQTSLNDTFLEMHTSDISCLSSLTKGEADKAHRNVLPGFQLFPGIESLAQQVHVIPLYGSLESYRLSGLSRCMNQ